jgi:hypothetical protein
MFVSCLYVVLSCVGRGLCDGLTTRSEEPYRASVSDEYRGQGSNMGCNAIGGKLPTRPCSNSRG